MTTNKQLHVNLFGSPLMTINGNPVPALPSSKVQTLFFYLLLSGREHSRESLAAFFWPEMTTAKSKTNLRNALSNLRKNLGEFLQISRQTVSFNRETNYWVDVLVFEEVVHSPLAEDTLVAWQTAVDLYRDEFLAGIHIYGAEPVESWLMGERLRLNQLLVDALYKLGAYYQDHHKPNAALQTLNRLLEIEPWHEEASLLKMKVLAETGQRTAALAQYERLRASLEAEFGTEPAQETQQYYQKLLTAVAVPPHNLPSEPDAFEGREEEIQQIIANIHKPECRLLTLLGPGGTGKSRLAIHTAHQLIQSGAAQDLFPDGLFILAIEQIYHQSHNEIRFGTENLLERLAILVATNLNIKIRPGIPPNQQVKAYLEDKKIGLILDGLEHLLEDAAPQIIQYLNNLLAQSPGIFLLVTSRVRLNIRAEWVMVIAGLSFPQVETYQSLEDYSASRLFLARVRAIDQSFVPSAKDKAAIIQICQLTGGMPLALEMAASWLPVLSCAEIAQEIRHGLDILTSEMHDLPDRQKSVRAVLNTSWDMLGEAEQELLVKLSIFRGPFRRQSSQQIVEAAPQELLTLINKSWLRQVEEHWFQIHTLMRQFLEEKQEEKLEEFARIQQRFTEYYITYLINTLPDLRNEKYEVIRNIQKEQENIGQAINFVVARRDAATIEEIVEPLYFYLVQTGQLDTADYLFYEIAELLHPVEHEGAIAIVNLLRADINIYLGKLVKAQAMLEENFPVLEKYQHIRGRGYAFAWYVAGRVAQIYGDYQTAKECTEKSMAIYTEAGDLRSVTSARVLLCKNAASRQDIAEAKKQATLALTDFQKYKNKQGEGNALWLLGELALMEHDFPRAKTYLVQSHAVHHAQDLNPYIVDSLNGLAKLSLATQKLDEAAVYLREAIKIAYRSHRRIQLYTSLYLYTRFLKAKGQYELALTILLKLKGELALPAFYKEESRDLEAALVDILPERAVARAKANSMLLNDILHDLFLRS